MGQFCYLYTLLIGRLSARHLLLFTSTNACTLIPLSSGKYIPEYNIRLFFGKTKFFMEFTPVPLRFKLYIYLCISTAGDAVCRIFAFLSAIFQFVYNNNYKIAVL